MTDMELRRCRKCNEEKPSTGFSRNKSRADGLCVQCKVCMRKAADEWCAKNKDRVAAMCARFYKRHQEKQDALSKAWAEKNIDRIREIKRNSANKSYRLNPSVFCATQSATRARRLKATPSWADESIISDMYKLASIYTKAGYKAHVDHIVPLKSKAVCGLHTHDNLTVLPATVNISKGNRYWPDMA